MAKALQISRDSTWQPWPKLVSAWRQALTPPGGRLDHRALLEPVEYLWLTYTRQQLERRWSQKMERTSELTLARAYVLGFHLANVARAALPFLRLKKELSGFFSERTSEAWRVLDIGAGSGAGAQAAAMALSEISPRPLRFSFHLFDQSPELLTLAQTMLSKLNLGPVDAVQLQIGSGELLKRLQGLSATSEESNLINFGYVWNEVHGDPKARAEILAALKVLLSSGAARTWLLISEPAAEVPSRETMQLRDRLCEMGWAPLYPCPGHQNCPLLAAGRDWCFSELSVKFPQEMLNLDRAIGRNQSTIGSSVYLFTNRAQERRAWPSTARIVGRPAAGKKAWLVTCAEGGLTRIPHPPLALRKWAQKNPRGSAYVKKRRPSRFEP